MLYKKGQVRIIKLTLSYKANESATKIKHMIFLWFVGVLNDC